MFINPLRWPHTDQNQTEDEAALTAALLLIESAVLKTSSAVSKICLCLCEINLRWDKTVDVVVELLLVFAD